MARGNAHSTHNSLSSSASAVVVHHLLVSHRSACESNVWTVRALGLFERPAAAQRCQSSLTPNSLTPPPSPPHPSYHNPSDRMTFSSVFPLPDMQNHVTRLVGRSEGRAVARSKGPLIAICALIYAWAANGRKIRLVMHNSSHFSGVSQPSNHWTPVATSSSSQSAPGRI